MTANIEGLYLGECVICGRLFAGAEDPYCGSLSCAETYRVRQRRVSGEDEAEQDLITNNYQIRKHAKSRAGKGLIGVYLIQAENGFYKIGKSTDVRKRFVILAFESAVALELVHVIKCKNEKQCDELEYRMHRMFATRRHHGEWFALTPEQVEEFKKVKP